MFPPRSTIDQQKHPRGLLEPGLLTEARTPAGVIRFTWVYNEYLSTFSDSTTRETIFLAISKPSELFHENPFLLLYLLVMIGTLFWSEKPTEIFHKSTTILVARIRHGSFIKSIRKTSPVVPSTWKKIMLLIVHTVLCFRRSVPPKSVPYDSSPSRNMLIWLQYGIHTPWIFFDTFLKQLNEGIREINTSFLVQHLTHRLDLLRMIFSP